jgi:predicted nucleotidyltransferase
MAQKSALNISQKYASAVRNQFESCRIFLFGSQVKGTKHKDSDIDIAVVLRNFENKLDILLKLMQLRRNIDSRIEPHPFRESEFNDNNQLVEEILSHGIEIK